MRCYDEGEKAMWQTRFNGPDKHNNENRSRNNYIYKKYYC